MSVTRFKIDINNLPKGSFVIPEEVIAKSRKRINELMEPVIREAHRKRLMSIQKSKNIYIR